MPEDGLYVPDAGVSNEMLYQCEGYTDNGRVYVGSRNGKQDGEAQHPQP